MARPEGLVPPAAYRLMASERPSVRAVSRPPPLTPSCRVGLRPRLLALLDRRALEPPDLAPQLRALSVHLVLRELRAELLERGWLNGIHETGVPAVHGGTPVTV